MQLKQIYPSFGDQSAQNSKQNSGHGKKITPELYDLIRKKFLSGNASISNKDTAVSKQKVEIDTARGRKTISVLGDFLRVNSEDDRNNRKTDWFQIIESKENMKVDESTFSLVKHIMTGKTQSATEIFNSLVRSRILTKVGEMKKQVMANVLKPKK